MDDEIRIFAEGRPAAAPYPERARLGAREDLVRAARGRARFRRLPRVGWQAVAAFGVTAAVVGGVSVALTRPEPGMTAAPRGAYMLIETQVTMSGAGRTHRGKEQLWVSTGDLASVAMRREPIEGMEMKQPTSWLRWNGCRAAPLPSDVEGMRRLIYDATEPGEKDRELAAFEQARRLLKERYFTAEQQEALWAVLGAMPGVRRVEDVPDDLGRLGTAFQMDVKAAPARRIIVDPESGEYLGQGYDGPMDRFVLESSVRLGVRMVDELPQVDGARVEQGPCERRDPEPTPSVTGTVSPTPIPG
ncbi:hypothetical protein [Nonomuraea typhae]|uniref:hypothetical protein n=1 Tax=Nonomuraea typhae TaxID=2603600 RepID=UPI0012F78682|nr:hypothetical protein [Nonomuraea typhae]